MMSGILSSSPARTVRATAPAPRPEVSPGRRNAILDLALGIGAGLLIAASVPPWGFWPAAVVGVSLLHLRLIGRRAPERLRTGLTAGMALYGATLWWMAEFTLPGYFAVVVLEASFLAIAAVATPAGSDESVAGRAAGIVSLPAALVLSEALRGSWPFGGLPLGGLALGQAASPLAPSARVGGHLLVVAVTPLLGVGVGGLARWGWELRRPGPIAHLPGGALPVVATPLPVAALAALAALAVATLAVAIGHLAPDGGGPRAGDTVDAAAVQGGGRRGYRDVDTPDWLVFDSHLAASERLRPPLDLVLWPENVVAVDRLEGSAEEDTVAALARATGATVVAGVTDDVAGNRFRNVAVAWAPSGHIVDRYTKVRRVPFGEYVPARSFFSLLGDLSPIPRDAVAGRGPGLLRTPAGPLGAMISFEVFFAERGRAAARAGGEVLLVPTNAASYRTSQVPSQELAAARLRAWETGRNLVQAAPTGYSAVVDHRGRVLARSRLGARELLTARVGRRTGITPYVRWGDGPVLALAGLALAGSWIVARRSRI